MYQQPTTLVRAHHLSLLLVVAGAGKVLESLLHTAGDAAGCTCRSLMRLSCLRGGASAAALVAGCKVVLR